MPVQPTVVRFSTSGIVLDVTLSDNLLKSRDTKPRSGLESATFLCSPIPSAIMDVKLMEQFPSCLLSSARDMHYPVYLFSIKVSIIIVGQDQLLLVCDNASPTNRGAFFDIRYCVGRNPVRQFIEVPRYHASFWAWKCYLSVFSDTRCYNGCETDGTIPVLFVIIGTWYALSRLPVQYQSQYNNCRTGPVIVVCDNASPTNRGAFFDIRYCVGRNPVRQLIEVPRYQASFWAWTCFLSVFSDAITDAKLMEHNWAIPVLFVIISTCYALSRLPVQYQSQYNNNNNKSNNNRNNNYYCYYYYYNFISRGKLIWHECQSNIWSSDTKTYMRLIIKMKIIYNMYRAMRSPYIKHAASGLPNPTRLEGEIRFIQAQDQQMLSHVVLEW